MSELIRFNPAGKKDVADKKFSINYDTEETKTILFPNGDQIKGRHMIINFLNRINISLTHEEDEYGFVYGNVDGSAVGIAPGWCMIITDIVTSKNRITFSHRAALQRVNTKLPNETKTTNSIIKWDLVIR